MENSLEKKQTQFVVSLGLVETIMDIVVDVIVV
jgi:hypothetical protein